MKKIILFFKNIFSRDNDPLYSCKVYKEIGCSHIDGYTCDMKTCQILEDYKTRELEQQLDISLKNRINKLPSK